MRGGCITVLVYILTLWQSLALVTQLVEQTDPTIASYDVPYDPVEPVNLLQGRQVFIIQGLQELDPRVGKLVAWVRTWKTENSGIEKRETKDVEIIPCSQIEELRTDFDLSIASFGYSCVAPDIEIWGNSFDSKTKESVSFSVLGIDFKLCNKKWD